ncbi:hypothetical protein H9635_04115 [Solibacillus sp. A46]|uniref:Uncharacterized protein n=1 Tax=Solibacillus faecavium TaxID=2762221 RepID=A0ABR8XVE6_9BACL|nr:hypothetical protein [Solibacillus faecavium]MBD8035914.1 hypothetical protein [Solibacillus faecavium]
MRNGLTLKIIVYCQTEMSIGVVCFLEVYATILAIIYTCPFVAELRYCSFLHVLLSISLIPTFRYCPFQLFMLN